MNAMGRSPNGNSAVRGGAYDGVAVKTDDRGRER